jgi:hypothetical protein
MAPDTIGVPDPGPAVRADPPDRPAVASPDFDPYIPRRVVPLGEHHVDGWRLKLHGLFATGDTTTDPAARVGALRAADDALPRPASGGGRYGVGFVIVHRATNAYSYVVGWWSYNCLLSLAAYTARVSDPADVARSPARQAGCVWELAVIDHERRAWTESVMRAGPEADLEAYLAAVLTAEV